VIENTRDEKRVDVRTLENNRVAGGIKCGPKGLSTLASIQLRVVATGCWPKAQLNPSAGPSSQLQLDKGNVSPKLAWIQSKFCAC
jgi:hypothetical protein